jgi:anti-sigma factor RsiW
MTPHGIRPELLGGYADGELPEEACRRVEAWLKSHPDDAAAVEEARRFVLLMRNNPPPFPSSDRWNGVLGKIHAGLPAGPSALPPPRRWVGTWLPGIVATAALIGAAWLARPWWAPVPGNPRGNLQVENKGHDLQTRPEDDPNQAFPVALASEVNIISIRVEDAEAVALDVPLMGPFLWATMEDIQVLDVQPHQIDGQMPRLEPGSVPMIVSSIPGRLP